MIIRRLKTEYYLLVLQFHGPINTLRTGKFRRPLKVLEQAYQISYKEEIDTIDDKSIDWSKKQISLQYSKV